MDGWIMDGFILLTLPLAEKKELLLFAIKEEERTRSSLNVEFDI